MEVVQAHKHMCYNGRERKVTEERILKNATPTCLSVYDLCVVIGGSVTRRGDITLKSHSLLDTSGVNFYITFMALHS